MSNFVHGAGIGHVSVVSRAPNKLDAFVVGMDGRVYTAAWQEGSAEWKGWWRIDGIEAAPCAPVCAISRSANKLDIFVVGLDGQVYGAAWETGNTPWYGWWRVGNGLKTVLHAPVSAVSRSANKMDLFVTGLNGYVYQTSWQPGDTQWRGWFRVKNNIQAPPGAPVSAVSRSQDKIDIFTVGQDGRVYTAAWQNGNTQWGGWWHIPGFDTLPRTPVAAVCRSKDKLDIFAVGKNGRVYTAAWERGDTQWRGWWTVGSISAPLRATVSAVSRSTDKLDIFVSRLAGGRTYTSAWQPGSQWTAWRAIWNISPVAYTSVGVVSRNTDIINIVGAGSNGRVYTAAWRRSDPVWRERYTLDDIVTGMTNPRVNEWTKVGVAFKQENNEYSDEAQGVTTDGAAWFLSSNSGGEKKNKRTISKYNLQANRLGKITLPQNLWNKKVHIGAPGYFDGWIYVPVQHPYGVWKVTSSFSAQRPFLPIQEVKGPDYDRFPWCDVNPFNGRLYTSENRERNKILFAYDRETLERRPEDDIQLGSTPIHFDRIQGGVFTLRGRLIISRSGPNGIFCFSAITGHCFGGKHLGNFGSFSSEVEGVTVRPWKFGSTPANVHVLELDNDNSIPTWLGGGGGDDCYLHSYKVPDPERL